jgi:CoA:oxalate CoA-transferase
VHSRATSPANCLRRSELGDDVRFKTNRDRLKNSQALREIFEGWCETMADRAEVLRTLDAERVPCAPLYKLEESMAHPHMRQRKTVRRVKHDTIGEFDIPGLPVKFSAWPDRTDVHASRIGEDNEAVLREVLGMPEAEISALYDEGVLLRPTATESAPKAAS